MKARTMEIEASCMREATQDPSPAMLRLSALEARCRHAEDENLQLRVQVSHRSPPPPPLSPSRSIMGVDVLFHLISVLALTGQ